MKKLGFIIGLMFVFLLGNAQKAFLNLNSGKTFEAKDGLAEDTIHGTTSINKYIHVNVDYLYYYNVEVDLDSIVDGGSVNLYLYGANDIDGTYTQLGPTQTWDIADTEGKTFWFNNTTYTWTEDFAADSVTTVSYTQPGTFWKYLKFTATGVGATTEISLDAIRAKIVRVP
jgi:hypothetical protein